MLTWRLCGCGFIVAAGGLLAEPAVFAQSLNTGTYPPRNSMTSGSSGGMFGSTSSTAGGTGGGNTGRGGGGSTGFGASAGGSTGFGTGGNTGFGTGQSQTGRNAQGGNNGFLGVNNNTTNFLGRNNQGQQGGNNNQFGQNRGGGGQRGLDQQLQNMLNGGGQNGGNNANNRNMGVRPRQKVAFEHPTLQTPVVVKGIEGRFNKMSTRHPFLKSIEIAAGDDGTVVLRGSVASENAAKLTESLVRLEPGVKSVKNELAFPPPAAAE